MSPDAKKVAQDQAQFLSQHIGHELVYVVHPEKPFTTGKLLRYVFDSYICSHKLFLESQGPFPQHVWTDQVKDCKTCNPNYKPGY